MAEEGRHPGCGKVRSKRRHRRDGLPVRTSDCGVVSCGASGVRFATGHGPEQSENCLVRVSMSSGPLFVRTTGRRAWQVCRRRADCRRARHHMRHGRHQTYRCQSAARVGSCSAWDRAASSGSWLGAAGLLSMGCVPSTGAGRPSMTAGVAKGGYDRHGSVKSSATRIPTGTAAAPDTTATITQAISLAFLSRPSRGSLDP